MLGCMSQKSGELQFLQELREKSRTQANPRLRLGIGDDCAVLRVPSGYDLLVTTDFSLEGRHFRRDWHPARSAGHRCLARGLSDLAAMGARPLAAFLSLALPAGTMKAARARVWVDDFLAGLLELAKATGTPLAGGDTATAPGDAILADIVLTGSAPRGRELRRSRGRPGDGIYVTGALGGSAAELRMLAQKPARLSRAQPDGTHPHLFPVPRLAAGQALLRRGLATAAIDISDGLSTDLLHLCTESGCAAVLDEAAIPLHPLAESQADGLALALHGGEDYELLFTAPPRKMLATKVAGTRVQRIGRLIAGPPKITLETQNGPVDLKPGGWEHRL